MEMLSTKVFLAQQQDVDLAVSKARESSKGHWSKITSRVKEKILLEFATLLERDRLGPA